MIAPACTKYNTPTSSSEFLGGCRSTVSKLRRAWVASEVPFAACLRPSRSSGNVETVKRPFPNHQSNSRQAPAVPLFSKGKGRKAVARHARVFLLGNQ